MNTKQILKTIEIPSYKETIAHASALADILKMVSTLSVIDVKIEDTKMMFGRKTENVYRHNEWNIEVRNEGNELTAQRLNIIAATGIYSITVPFALVNDFLSAMGIKPAKSALSELPVSVLLIDSDISTHIKNAGKFADAKNERECFKYVCLHLKDGFIRVVSTDAIKLYYSNWVKCGYKGDEKKMLIDGDYSSVKNATSIDTFADGSILIGGVRFALADFNFVNYESVIPPYEAYMEFEKKEFVKLVKGGLLTANKITHKINLHLNGRIDMNSADNFQSDWITDEETMVSNFSMNYDNKTFDDTDISFDGKKLLSCLSVIPNEKVKMFTDGLSNRAVIFNAADADVLLMPILINS